jgi:hypothetical protein
VITGAKVIEHHFTPGVELDLFSSSSPAAH